MGLGQAGRQAGRQAGWGGGGTWVRMPIRPRGALCPSPSTTPKPTAATQAHHEPCTVGKAPPCVLQGSGGQTAPFVPSIQAAGQLGRGRPSFPTTTCRPSPTLLCTIGQTIGILCEPSSVCVFSTGCVAVCVCVWGMGGGAWGTLSI